MVLTARLDCRESNKIKKIYIMMEEQEKLNFMTHECIIFDGYISDYKKVVLHS